MQQKENAGSNKSSRAGAGLEAVPEEHPGAELLGCG